MNAEKPPIQQSLPEKLQWIEDRYWKVGLDDDFNDYLADLYEIDAKGEMTSGPRRDALNGATRRLMVLGASGNGKTSMFNRTLRANQVLTDISEGGNLGH